MKLSAEFHAAKLGADASAPEMEISTGTQVARDMEPSPVQSVNGQTGDVMLGADDVGALPADTVIPTKVSQLDNDSEFVDAKGAAAAAPVQSVNGKTGAVTVSVPTKVSQLDNDSAFVDAAGAAAAAPVQSVNGQTGAVALTIPETAADVGALPDDTKYAESLSVGGPAKIAGGIHLGQVDTTSTATAFTAQIPGITEYYNGLTLMLKNGVVTSAAGFTINVNGLGAKPVYTNLAAATAETTKFNVNYTMVFVYDVDRVSGGCWVCYNGYDSNTNTIGYQVRTNSSRLPMQSATYRYRLLFTSADGTKLVPANNSTSTNATAARAVCQDKIDPWGTIFYYGSTTVLAAGEMPGAASIWQQYLLTLGYSFNRTGAALTLTANKPVYVKAAPQADGSAIIDDTQPYVQSLPTTEDGKIYIFLGIATSATQIELQVNHPVYYYKSGAIRQWTNAA